MALNNLQPATQDILSVGDFTRQVKSLLEGELAPGWIRGEVSNLRKQSSGHIYFTLKDQESQLSCALFRGDAMRQRITLQNGVQVVVYGQVSVYEPRGAYQYICRFVLEDGLGHLQIAYNQLKAKLQAEGLFAPERKRPLPRLPQTIGFITSPTGAAIRDFLSIMRRRAWRGRIVVIPVKVQGAGAATEIIDGIRAAEQWGRCDILVIGRGGGSLEDLWCFNEEAVARAVAECKIPVISAVGHEIDFALSDFVADVRAETPSAAAELVTSIYLDVRQCVSDLTKRLSDGVVAELQQLSQALALAASCLNAQSPKNNIEQAYLKIDDLSNRLAAHYARQLNAIRMRFMALSHQLYAASPAQQLAIGQQQLAHLRKSYFNALRQCGQAAHQQLTHLERRLKAASPEDILRRGFVMVRDEHGNVVTRKVQVAAGQSLSNTFFDGEITVNVNRSQ